MNDNDLEGPFYSELSYKGKLADHRGWLVESLTEADDSVLEAVADAALKQDILVLGAVVLSAIQDYCGYEDATYNSTLRSINNNLRCENRVLKKERDYLQDAIDDLYGRGAGKL